LTLLPEPPLPQLVEELVETVTQALLVLAQIAHLAVALLGLTPLAITPHVLQFLEQPARGILVAGARQIFHPVEHALEILLAQRARVTIKRPRKLLRILAHLLGKSLQELV